MYGEVAPRPLIYFNEEYDRQVNIALYCFFFSKQFIFFNEEYDRQNNIALYCYSIYSDDNKRFIVCKAFYLGDIDMVTYKVNA